MIDRETGVLVPPNDPQALREAIDSLLASPELRAQMGKRAALRVRPFTVSVVTDQIEEAMREMVGTDR